MDSPTLGAFLQPHILAIMTYLNEVLQEVQGKKTPAFKAMVIRSLGMVISLWLQYKHICSFLSSLRRPCPLGKSL